jgi:hypothetical protein
MTLDSSRRTALVSVGALAVGTAALAAGSSQAATTAQIIPPGAQERRDLMNRLRRAPRRRDFKTVPMILEQSDFWDNEALKEIIAYRGAHKQVWDNTNLAGAWLNLMRNSINAQIFSFGHKDFLAVSATHGTAHLALFDHVIWEKYELATLTGGLGETRALPCFLAQGPSSAVSVQSIILTLKRLERCASRRFIREFKRKLSPRSHHRSLERASPVLCDPGERRPNACLYS